MSEKINGIINVYKEVGWTSFDVVAKMRGICHIRKIGHAGTLDPAAEGVLPVCVGKATRIADLLSDETKTYRAVLRFGAETDTLDQTGSIVRTAREEELKALEQQQVVDAVRSFVGGYEQIPPMYSARHVQGKRLYELAREGKEVERKPVPVRIDDIAIDRLCLDCSGEKRLPADEPDSDAQMFHSYPFAVITVTCGRGTYIRSLCADIGARIGCGAVMTHLVRTRVGPFEMSESRTVAQIEEMQKEDARLSKLVIPTDQVFEKYPAAVVKEMQEKAACNGNKIPKGSVQFRHDSEKAQSALFRLYDRQGHFIGLFRHESETGLVRPVKMFYTGS